MKRICVVGAAMAALLTAGIPAVASAATTKQATQRATTTTATATVSCSFGLVTQIPSTDTAVQTGAASGRQFGNIGCKTPLYRGVAHDQFAQSDQGNLSGPIQQYFGIGALFGTFKLAVNSNVAPSPTGFSQASYVGKITITRGTGALRGTAGAGTMRCKSNDQAHYACTERLKLTQTLSTTGTSTSGSSSAS